MPVNITNAQGYEVHTSVPYPSLLAQHGATGVLWIFAAGQSWLSASLRPRPRRPYEHFWFVSPQRERPCFPSVVT